MARTTSYRLLKNWQMSHGQWWLPQPGMIQWTCWLLQRAAGPASPLCRKWSPQEHTQTLWAFNWKVFSRTFRKGTTKNPAGIFLVSKAWFRLLSPSHETSCKIIQITEDLDSFLFQEHFRNTPNHWERSPVFHLAVVPTCGLTAGAVWNQRKQSWTHTHDAISFTVSFPPCNCHVHKLRGVQMSNICLFNLLPQPLPYPAPTQACSSMCVPTPASATPQRAR